MIRLLPLLVAQLCIQMGMSELGSVKHGLLHEVLKCLIPPITTQKPESNGIVGENAVQVLGGLESCWKTAFQACHEYKSRQTEWYVRKNALCGGMNIKSGRKLQSYIYMYSVKVYSKYGTLFHFIEFNFPCSTWCQKAQLSINPKAEDQNRVAYCGKRVPWKLAYWDSFHTIIFTNSKISQDFSFILEYTAIDRASPEMTMTEEIFVTFVKGDKRSIPLQYSPFGNGSKDLHHDFVSYFFVSHVLDVVCIDLVPNKYTQLYDGPGRRSQFVNIPWRYYGRQFYYCFRSFLGSVWLSSNEQDYIKWDTRTNLYQDDSCETYNSINEKLFIAQDNGYGLHCVWETQQRPEEIRLEQVRFHGFNMFMFMTQAAYRDSNYVRLCEYGGLYILYKDTYTHWNRDEMRRVAGNTITYLSLCTNIYNRPSIHLPLRGKNITAAYLVFITFKHYSTGSFKILFRNSDCKGYHYEYYPCPDYPSTYFGNLDRPPYYYTNHNLRDFWGTSDTGIPSCKAISLMLNLDGDGRVHYNCQVNNTFQSLTNVFMVGPQRIYVHNWIIPLTHHTGIRQHTDHYNFHLTATVLKDFPVDMTEIEQTIVVHRDQPRSAYVKHLRELTFSTYNSLEDMHATIIKIQLLQNLICTDTQSTHNIKAHIPHLFITAERITSRIKHHDSRIPLKQPYCTQVLENKSCATNGTSSAIIVIDQVYLHHSYGYKAEKNRNYIEYNND